MRGISEDDLPKESERWNNLVQRYDALTYKGEYEPFMVFLYLF